jgi:hypothetical protein
VNRSKPLKARTPLNRGAGLKAGTGLKRGARLAPVSSKRRAENRRRRAMVSELWPERPMCAWPDCARFADDVHEPLTRARGGSITDPGNAVPLCRPHHDHVTFTPESELGEAYLLGLLRHSWNATPKTSPEGAKP